MIVKDKESIISSDINLNNRSMRMPILFCIEMVDEYEAKIIIKKIEELLKVIFNDKTLRRCAEIGVLIFGGEPEDDPKNGIRVIREFSTVSDGILNFHINYSQKSDAIPLLGQALCKSINIIKNVKSEYILKGWNYYQPNLIVFSSGNHRDSLEKPISQIERAKNTKAMTVISIAVNSVLGVNYEALESISTDGNIYEDSDFSKLFKLIRNSMSSMSASTSDAYMNLLQSAAGWDEIKKQRRYAK